MSEVVHLDSVGLQVTPELLCKLNESYIKSSGWPSFFSMSKCYEKNEFMEKVKIIIIIIIIEENPQK